MAFKTIYTCDKCGNEQEKPDQFWTVGVSATHCVYPSHDVAGLVEALESAKNLIANHSGEVLTDEYAGDQIEQIDAALAAYRKTEVKK